MISPLPLLAEVPFCTLMVTTEGRTASATASARQLPAAAVLLAGWSCVARTIAPPATPPSRAMPTAAAARTTGLRVIGCSRVTLLPSTTGPCTAHGTPVGRDTPAL